ncbi:MAG TPA: caspase family protein [Anaeromyxobacter sp.]|nr:caspase family protein [Anaeromyxobacter sp.]
MTSPIRVKRVRAPRSRAGTCRPSCGPGGCSAGTGSAARRLLRWAFAVTVAASAAVPGAPRSAPDLRPAAPVVCGPDGSGRVRGLLVGVDRYRETDASGRPWFERLRGSANDVELLADRLRGAGRARPEDVRILVDEDATEARVFRALNDLVAATGCGDFVVFHFSGHSWHGSLALHDASRDGPGTITEGQLRRAVTALRNRGAFVFVHLDTLATERLELDVGREARWRIAPASSSGAGELGPDAGGIATFHAGGLPFELAVDTSGGARPGRKVVYGLFTFATAAALGGGALPTLRELAARIGDRMAPAARPGLVPSPVFEATEPDRVIFATGVGPRTSARPPAPPRGRIEILEPARVRGVQLVQSSVLRVTGRVAPAHGIAAVLVSGAQVAVLDGGRFEATVPLQPGRQTLYAAVIFEDGGLDEDSLVVEGPAAPDVPPPRASRRYALVIGNEEYRKPIARLETPIRDAEAVAELLRRRFGFETTLRLRDGREAGLVLRNAGRSAIYTALSQLHEVDPEDVVLIFYAGHGERFRNLVGSYWLPVDAERGNQSNWISADEIARQVVTLAARHVLIVSDSCFSGDLLAGGPVAAPAEAGGGSGGPSGMGSGAPGEAGRGGRVESRSQAPGDQRAQFLYEVGSRTSRRLLSSGANEPVRDGGGDGHSVFARALLNALQGIPEDAFTATELFVRIQGQVGRSGQVPQFTSLRAGDTGGDVVFERRPETAALGPSH